MRRIRGDALGNMDMHYRIRITVHGKEKKYERGSEVGGIRI
jgi:hypothetical protein